MTTDPKWLTPKRIALLVEHELANSPAHAGDMVKSGQIRLDGERIIAPAGALFLGSNCLGCDPRFREGDIVLQGMYVQFEPDTPISAAVKALTIVGGNFTNVLLQPSWDVRRRYSRVDFCSHKHPHWVPLGLRKCPAVCVHRSTEPSWQPCSADEFRRGHDDPKRTVRIVPATTDEYGVTVRDERFEELRYTYEDKRL